MGITDVISLDVHFLSSNYYRDSGIQYHPVDIADEAEPTKNYIPLFLEASDLIDRITRKGGNLLCITILGPSWSYRSWTYNYMSKVVSSNPVHGEAYSIQQHKI